MASNSIAPIPCCVSKNDGCKSAHGVIFLRRRAVARWVRKNKHSNDNPGNNKVTCCRLGSAARKDTRSIESRAAKTALRLHVLETKAMQKVDTAPMGQKKHHPFGVRTTPLVTTRSHAAKAAARPYKTRFLLKARTICFRSTQTRFSLFHFGMHPLGIIMFALSPEMKICTAFLLGVRPHPNGPRAMFFQSLQDKNGIRRSKMLPQAQPKCCTFTKSVQQIYCVLGWCACSGQKRHTRWPATTSGCCCLFVPSLTDHGILGLKDFRVKRF